MVKKMDIRGTGSSGLRISLGNKNGEIAELGTKFLHSATSLGNKLSEYGHYVLDNPVAEGVIGSVLGPEALVGGKVGLNLLDRGLKFANPASQVLDNARRPNRTFNPMLS
jgi:hypothetical protein